MSDFRFVNTKGLIAHPTWTPVLTQNAVDVIKSKLAIWDPADKRLAKWNEIVGLLEQFPLAKYHGGQFNAKDDIAPGSAKGNWQNPTIPTRMMVDVTTFKTSSAADYSAAKDAPSNPEQWGWQPASALAKMSTQLGEMIKALDVRITLSMDPFKRGQGLAKKFNTEFNIKSNDPTADLAEVEAFVLYIPSSSGVPGFLDGRANVSPLSGARMFESAASAATTRRSRGLTDAVVVGVHARLTRIAPDQDLRSTPGMDPLREALAFNDRRDIEEALEQATIEQLKARLALLEPPAPEEAPVPRKRM